MKRGCVNGEGGRCVCGGGREVEEGMYGVERKSTQEGKGA